MAFIVTLRKSILLVLSACFLPSSVARDDADFRCDMAPESGNCKQQQLRWYHDAKEAGACKEFVFGGCGGNTNNFGSKLECERACVEGSRPVTIVDDVCLMGNPCGLYQRCIPEPLVCSPGTPCVVPEKTYRCEAFKNVPPDGFRGRRRALTKTLTK